MPSVRDLRDRIRSMKNTEQITKAMKQVAAAKIRRADALRKQSRPYADALAQMLQDLLAAVGTVDHPFMKPGREGAPDLCAVCRLGNRRYSRLGNLRYGPRRSHCALVSSFPRTNQ